MDTDPVKVIDVLSQERDDEHLARSRAEDERDHLRAEVDRLQALVQQMSEVTTVQACRGCGQYVRPRYMEDRLCATCWRALAGRQHEALNAVWDCYCSDRVATQPGTVDAVVFACLANPDSQRAGEEYAALVAVAKAADGAMKLADGCHLMPDHKEAVERAIAHLRAARGGKGTEEG